MSVANLQEYRSIKSIEECVEESREHPVLILKHSATCPTSHYAKVEVDKLVKEGSHAVYLLVVQENRPLSAQIAETLSVKHESPQLLILENGAVKAVLNHYDIVYATIQSNLD